MKQWKKWLRFLGIVLLTVLVMLTIIFKLYTSNAYAPDDSTTQLITEELRAQVHAYEDDNGSMFAPADGKYRAILAFYPGGKVEYHAYDALMYELASRGFLCVLPKMPENLAFFRVHAVEHIQEDHEEEIAQVGELDWFLAGHSLGGVAACSCAADAPDLYRGLIMCASYPSVDLTETGIPMLSIRGERDGVLNREKYEESKAFWPADTKEVVIDGGIHSFFGCYGVQEGDGTPHITNEEQIQRTADIMADWMNELIEE